MHTGGRPATRRAWINDQIYVPFGYLPNANRVVGNSTSPAGLLAGSPWRARRRTYSGSPDCWGNPTQRMTAALDLRWGLRAAGLLSAPADRRPRRAALLDLSSVDSIRLRKSAGKVAAHYGLPPSSRISDLRSFTGQIARLFVKRDSGARPRHWC